VPAPVQRLGTRGAPSATRRRPPRNSCAEHYRPSSRPPARPTAPRCRGREYRSADPRTGVRRNPWQSRCRSSPPASTNPRSHDTPQHQYVGRPNGYSTYRAAGARRRAAALRGRSRSARARFVEDGPCWRGGTRVGPRALHGAPALPHSVCLPDLRLSAHVRATSGAAIGGRWRAGAALYLRLTTARCSASAAPFALARPAPAGGGARRRRAVGVRDDAAGVDALPPELHTGRAAALDWDAGGFAGDGARHHASKPAAPRRTWRARAAVHDEISGSRFVSHSTSPSAPPTPAASSSAARRSKLWATRAEARHLHALAAAARLGLHSRARRPARRSRLTRPDLRPFVGLC